LLNILSRSNDNTNNSRSQTKRTSTNLIYNAHRYSPKTTTRGPTTSSALHTRSNRNLVRRKKFLFLPKNNFHDLKNVTIE